MDRRTLLTGGGNLLLAVALTREAAARSQPTPLTAQDTRFMQMAIKEAEGGDYPFGAVIVSGEEVLARGRNTSKRTADPTAHAEMVSIRTFLSHHSADQLKSATIYSSGEPCVMCMGAIIWCGFKRLVFGASIAQLATKIGQIDITSQQIADAAPFAKIEIAGGLLPDEELRLFGTDQH